MVATGAGQPYLFTTRQYDQMIAAGFFHPAARVELLAGRIIARSKQSVCHAMSRAHTNYARWEQLRDPYQVGVGIPILLDDLIEPEPDLVVYRRHSRTTMHTPADILLLVEIADGSLKYERDQKLPRYAAAGMPEAWLLGLTTGLLERHTEPSARRYRRLVTVRTGESLASTTLPTVTLSVGALLKQTW